MSNSNSNVPQALRNLGVRNMNITRLDLAPSYRLTKLPPQIGDLKKLEYLSLGFNKLTTLPPQIGKLENLRVLHLNNNKLKSLPSTIGKLTKLEKLDLSGNALESLPPQIGLCENLKKLNLDKNKLKTLPKEIIKLKTTNKYLENVTTDNQQLNQLWDSAKTQRDNYFIAQKYSLSPNIFQPSLVLKIHNEQDIDKNDPVLTEEGLVGRVKERSFFNAEVLLVHDIRSIIPVISQKSQLQGTLKGNGLERHGTMQYVKKTSSFEEGEKLFTSGLGDIFPKGIEVGKIVSIKDPVDSNFLEIKVDFSQSPVNKNYFLIYKDAKL